jgi:hypothetical protein
LKFTTDNTIEEMTRYVDRANKGGRPKIVPSYRTKGKWINKKTKEKG